MSDASQLAVAHNDTFDEDWTADLYRSSVMTKPGREIVAESPDGRIAAFAGYWIDERNKMGHFEPVGTPPEFQRRGLAKAVLLHAMRQMRRRAMTTVSVSHDAENVAARELYKSLGFVRQYDTHGWRKAKQS
jgi:ribosomal protein S18 acetylase RimI-like enzyme